ncbi:MAG: hypothetical protein ABSD20_21310 [Terriglobales bacterium]|jgi:hypothetical protein
MIPVFSSPHRTDPSAARLERMALAPSIAIEVFTRRDFHENEMDDLIVGLIAVQIEFHLSCEPRLLPLLMALS